MITLEVILIILIKNRLKLNTKTMFSERAILEMYFLREKF